MRKPAFAQSNFVVPAVIGLAGLVLLGFWWFAGPPNLQLKARVPGTDQAPGSELGTNGNAVLAGRVVPGEGQPADLPGVWPQFRGPDRNALLTKSVSLAQSWPPGGPKELWGLDVGEGYAGAVVL